MTPTDTDPTAPAAPEKRYRPNVGIVLFDPHGRVWIGRRPGAPHPLNWQFPQGGVDPGEDLLDAARRELAEETGVTSVTLLAQAEGWITYDFPAGMGGSKQARGFAGQTQAWFAFRFDGAESEIDLHAHHDIEFDRWRWAEIDETPALVAPFKRDAYLKVLAAFRPLVDQLRGLNGPAPESGRA